MALQAVQDLSQTGLNPSYTAAEASGDSYTNDERTFVSIKNDDASPHTATIQVQRTTFDVPGLGTLTFADIAVAVPAGEERWIQVPQGPYSDGNGRVQITYDAVASVTLAAVRVPLA